MRKVTSKERISGDKQLKNSRCLQAPWAAEVTGAGDRELGGQERWAQGTRARHVLRKTGPPGFKHSRFKASKTDFQHPASLSP